MRFLIVLFVIAISVFSSSCAMYDGNGNKVAYRPARDRIVVENNTPYDLGVEINGAPVIDYMLKPGQSYTYTIGYFATGQTFVVSTKGYDQNTREYKGMKTFNVRYSQGRNHKPTARVLEVRYLNAPPPIRKYF